MRRSFWLSRAARGLALLGLLGAAGCRFAPATTHWEEAFGSVQVKGLAAWPRGVVAIGLSTKVFRYPGHWNAPWIEMIGQTTTHVTASDEAVYALGADGTVQRRTHEGAGAAWNGVPAQPVATALAADEDDHVWSLVGGRLKRAGEAQPIGCASGVTAVAATHGVLYAVVAGGKLVRIENNQCQPENAPDGVTAVSAREGTIAVVAGGRVAQRAPGGAWATLPRLVLRRDGVKREVTPRTVARSRWQLWATDEEGHVFVLSEQ